MEVKVVSFEEANTDFDNTVDCCCSCCCLYIWAQAEQVEVMGDGT